MKLFLFELNEFNKTLLEEGVHHFDLKNIQKLISSYSSTTATADTYESDYLEPWVQWVSVHTGQPSSVHQIKHLGDVPDLNTLQIWQLLAKAGKTSGVWGAMNASIGQDQPCQFFFPDPWTASEKAQPKELNALLDPLRLVSKNYLSPDKKTILKLLKKLVALFKDRGLIKEILKEIPALIKNLAYFKGAHFVLIAFVEYFSARLFFTYKEQFKPDFSLLFINTLAHIQHHHWHDRDIKNNEKIKLGLNTIDRILGFVYQSLKEDEILLVTNALSQKNTFDEDPWVLYRPTSHKAFLNEIGIYPRKVDEHMTHDAHLYFETHEKCSEAFKILDQATVDNQKLFICESYTDNPTKLFYRLMFTGKVDKKTELEINHKKLNFLKYYQQIVTRTGKHIQEGTLYSSHPFIPPLIQNYEIFNYILDGFNSKELELILSGDVNKN